MSLNQRVTAEFSTCTPSAPPTADLSIQTIRSEPVNERFDLSAQERGPTSHPSRGPHGPYRHHLQLVQLSESKP